MKKYNGKVFSFDVETNGLQGKGFSVAAVIYEDGVETDSFLARCPISGEVNDWIAQNVLPQMTGISETHCTYKAMLKAFAEYYLANKENATVIVHMGMPVEARFMLDMHAIGAIGDWDMPYPLIDVAGNLQQAGCDPTSVDSYNQSRGIEVPACEGGTHNPLYDSRAVALCYMDLMSK